MNPRAYSLHDGALPIANDGRFADSAHPSLGDYVLGQSYVVPLAADVLFTGTVEQLRGAGSDQSLVPASALKDERATKEYKYHNLKYKLNV
jgi:hypothetical protein